MHEPPDRQQRLRAAFEAALLQEPSARDRFLDEVCVGDPELRRHVARLLAADANAGSFLAHPPEVVLAAPEAEAFSGTARFTIRQQLGVGGMGIVYEAYDRVRDEAVALKTLRRTGAADLYLLKREFRGLANVAHRNLVCLYELFVDDAHCFFTMELVHGVNFVDYVRGHAADGTRDERIVRTFTQLVEGVSALHRAGKLHRDIKPSNVLVTSEGRVVILDFGLLAELVPQDRAAGSHEAGGTPAYMSPEEASGPAPSEASDWYGVGVTLYESLTGRLPFTGSWVEVLSRKRECDPLPPREMNGDVPAALDAVCMGLLNRDPARRMSGTDALRRLRAREGTPAVAMEPAEEAIVRAAPFVGREREMAALNNAFDAVRRGGAATVHISGRSGIGKTALLRHFLSLLSTRDTVLVFQGRCYEHESVPYKALDGVVDSVSSYLRTLPRSMADTLMPRDVSVLCRLFPVLRQIGSVREAGARTEPESADPTTLRRRAVAALGDLLAAIARRQPVVLCIDDLQWTDADSTIVLEELLGSGAPAGILTVLCARSEEIASNPLLRSAFEATRAGALRLALDPMSEAEASALIASVVPEHALMAVDRSAIAAEAEGNPFLLEQFARHIAHLERGRPHQGDRTTFADVFAGQLHTLPAEARLFLETLALCGRPMPPEIVRDASSLAIEVRPLLALLRAAHVIRSSGSSDRIEPYHDRIREALVERIPPDIVRRLHGQLASVLRRRQIDDPEALFEHYRGAGDRDEGAVQAARAAERAAAALAFDTAASYYGHALDLASASPARYQWQVERAVALGNAGRPHEAGDAYLDAARASAPSTRVELQRRGAEQFLIGGHIDRGLDVLRTVLDEVGMYLPLGPRAALASMLWRRARLRWRGLTFVERQAADVPGEVLLRVDTCWSVMTGLATVDMIRASAFSALHVRLALDAGEPFRIARALAVEGAFSAMTGGQGRARSTPLFARSQALAVAVDHPHTTALSALTAGMAALGNGEWRAASDLCEEALATLRERCTGVTWELNTAQNFLLGALLYQGELQEVSNRLAPLLSEARSRGNLYVSTELCTRMNLVWLAADRPDEGERLAVESIERWSQSGFHRQHYSTMLARVLTALYRGDAHRAWELLEERWPDLQQSLLLRAQVVRVEASYLRARCALAMAATDGDARRFLAISETCARRIAREDMAWSNPIARLVEAAVAHLRRNAESSVERLTGAVAGFEQAGMQLYAAAARRRLADLVPEPQARELRRQSDEWMAGQRIMNPDFMTRMLAPGFRVHGAD